MDWPTVVLILGTLAILAAALVGGRMKATKDGVEFDSQGFLAWLTRAREQKVGTPAAAESAGERAGLRRDGQARDESRASATLADAVVKARGGKIPRARVLWVDDHPLNNLYERQALASLGIFADSYTTNNDAAHAMSLGAFDLVISDIGRDSGHESGWDLLRIFRARWPSVPFVFYVGDDSPAQRGRAAEEGAVGLTAKPDELMQVVVNGLAPSVRP